MVYSLRHTHNVQMANHWYRPKRQPLLKYSDLFRKAWREQKGTQDDPLLVSFFPPSSPSSMFNLLICIILKIIDCCTILGNYSPLFVTKLQRISHLSLNSASIQFPGAYFLPPKNIKVGPIIRIILVPPLSSVNLRRRRNQRGSGAGGLEPPQSETHPA